MATVTAVTRKAVPGFLVEIFSPSNRFITLIAVLAALGGFLFGYDTGVIGGAEPYIAKSLGIGSFGESWVVGSLLLGAIAGAFLSGKLADALSRKWTKFVAGCVYIAAALGSAFAPTLETLCVARFVLGIAVGTASFVAPMYISEHSPARLRGGMTAFNQFMITFGILIAYIADFALSGFANNWRWMLAFGAVPAICLAVAMVFVPHTPRWLVQRGRDDGQLGLQLPRLLLLPADDRRYHQGRHVLAVRILRRGGIAFFVWKLPETKDRTLEDIERQVHGGGTEGTAQTHAA